MRSPKMAVRIEEVRTFDCVRRCLQFLWDASKEVAMNSIAIRIVLLPLLVAAFLSGCRNESAPLAPENVATKSLPEFPSDPGDFVDTIDNPYLAYSPGKVFRYRSETEEGVETAVVEVTNRKKTILGVAITVVHDQVFLDGELIEDTFDWFAQDSEGNVWYFGEDSKEILNGQVVSTHGSWEAGVDGATPGIIMLAEPENGMKYEQEHAEGVAEDMARVVDLTASVEVMFGPFEGCLKTLEWTPLESGAREYKYYAPGVGLVLSAETGGKGTRTELTAIEE